MGWAAAELVTALKRQVLALEIDLRRGSTTMTSTAAKPARLTRGGATSTRRSPRSSRRPTGGNGATTGLRRRRWPGCC